jgi:hypothetical protein
VEFFDGLVSLGSAPLVGGTASLSTVFTTVGLHDLTATYSGDANNNGSTSPVATVQVVDKASPSTSTVLNAPATSIVGDPVALSATVSGGFSPTGTVEFFDGVDSLGSAPLVAGVAALPPVIFTTVGLHSLTATYSGDANNNPSTGGASLQVVEKALPSTSTAIGVPNSSVVGDSVTFTASVTGGYNPTGTVDFLDNGVVIGSGTLDGGGLTTFSTSALAVGDHPMTAHYLGDANNNESTSPVAVIQVVEKASPATSTAIGVPNSSTVGQSVTFTATVSGGYNPTGQVVFRDNGVSIGTGTLLAGIATFSTSSLAVGDHPMSAEYLGDGNNLGSTSPTEVIQVVDQSQSTTTLSASTNLSYLGDPVTFTVTVTGFSPTGTVDVRDNGNPLGTITLSNGSGSLITSSLTLGSHTIDAVYGGDTNNVGSTSDALTIIVSLVPPPAGGTSGHNLRGFSSTIGFMLTGSRGGGSIAPGAYGGGSPTGEFTQSQLNIICAVQRSVSSRGQFPVAWLARLLGTYFGMSPSVIEDALLNRSLCGSAAASSIPVANYSRIFPVDVAGVPVSSDPVWNACIRHQITISAETFRPLSCHRYHIGHKWTHPDTRVAFEWSDVYRKMIEISDNEPVLLLPLSR